MNTSRFALHNMLYRRNTEVCHRDWAELAYLVPAFPDEGGVGMADFCTETVGNLGATRILHRSQKSGRPGRVIAPAAKMPVRANLRPVNGQNGA